MARSTQEIYEAMLSDKESRQELSGLTNTSVTSIWRLFLYIVAASAHALEVLWDAYQSTVESTLSSMMPHRASWYASKALQYMDGMTLPDGNDEYDTNGMTDEDIAEKRIIKYAAAIENPDYSILYIKIAGENAGVLSPVTREQATSFTAYMNEVKDVGVRIEVVNKAADVYSCEIAVLYDPILAPGVVEDGVKEAITNYISNLPFNGEYSNMALIDAVQIVSGVKIAEVTKASATPSGATYPTSINLRYVPEAGYMTPGDIIVNLTPYTNYETGI